jgi:hypothetical protein
MAGKFTDALPGFERDRGRRIFEVAVSASGAQLPRSRNQGEAPPEGALKCCGENQASGRIP